MFPYVLLILSIFFFSFLEKEKISFACGSKVLDSRYLCCFFCIVELCLFMGLRHPSVGCDVLGYLDNRYYNSEILIEMPVERAFNYMNFFFHNIIKAPFQCFLFFTVCITCTSLFFVFFKYSIDVTFSILLYITIGTFSMALSGIRQTLAMSISWLSIYFIEKRKFLFFFTMILLASSFHNSAVIFFIAFPLWGIRLSRKMCIILFSITLSTFFFRIVLNPLIVFLQPSKYNRIDVFAGYDINPLVLFVPIVILLFCIVFNNYDNEKKCDYQDSFYFMFSCINFFFLILSLNNNQLGRLAFYFNIGNCVLIPSVIKKQEKYGTRAAKITKFIVISFALAYFFISTPGGTFRIDNYKMFWID